MTSLLVATIQWSPLVVWTSLCVCGVHRRPPLWLFWLVIRVRWPLYNSLRHPMKSIGMCKSIIYCNIILLCYPDTWLLLVKMDFSASGNGFLTPAPTGESPSHRLGYTVRYIESYIWICWVNHNSLALPSQYYSSEVHGEESNGGPNLVLRVQFRRQVLCDRRHWPTAESVLLQPGATSPHDRGPSSHGIMKWRMCISISWNVIYCNVCNSTPTNVSIYVVPFVYM